MFIIITTDILFEGEASILNRLFDEGMPLLHLRKPSSTKQEISGLLSLIDDQYFDRIVLHDHYDLLRMFSLRGIHLNKRNQYDPDIRQSSVSCSCHSFQSVASLMANHDYLFLSPIFDSISKTGYHHAFTAEQLTEAGKQGLINEKVIALGGVDEQTIPVAAGYGFGGVAVLGALWRNYLTDKDEISLIKRFNKLKKIANQQ